MEEIKMSSDSEGSPKKRVQWWPNYLLRLAVVFTIVVAALVVLSNNIQVPFHAPDLVPMPDEGENIPGPEWLFLLLWQGFWYFTGSLGKYLIIMPLSVIFIFVYMFFLPYYNKIPIAKIPGLGAILRKIAGMRSGFVKSFMYGIPVFIVAIAFSTAVYKTGHQAKVLGCDACHNPAMGQRQAVPPEDVAKYYTTDRARQIGSAKYRAGKTVAEGEGGDTKVVNPGEAQGYKDANWQMRHMYEPTFTW